MSLPRGLLILAVMNLFADELVGQEKVTHAWERVTELTCDGLHVALSRPRLVARSRGFLWFPSLVRTGDGRLMAVMSNYADEARETTTALVSFSADGGLSWSQVRESPYGESAVNSPSGDTLLLPYYLRFQSEDQLTGRAQAIERGSSELKPLPGIVEVTGWPRKVGPLDAELGGKPEWGLGSFVFNGQTVLAKDEKTHLATLYGRFAGAKRYSLAVAESLDGLKWKIRAMIADDACPLEGGEGPCESAMIRLKNGRLFCVFRVNSNLPFGQSFSDDDGATWSEPTAMAGPHSVQPSLDQSSGGIIALSGGRPGVKLWVNAQGDAANWGEIDLAAHHSAQVSDEPIETAAATPNSSSYTEIRWLDDSRFLVIYDRLANGWNAIPTDSEATNSVWVVRGEVAPEGR